jgi:chromate reductase, NAD(P)H dehydrogenase (quinone)
MKILVFAGSNSARSINKQLAEYVANLINDVDKEILNLNDYEVVMYSPEREENEGIPSKIIQLSEKISASDLIVLSLAEHNGSYSAAFKNIYDWLSRIPTRKVFDGRKLFLLATSPGARGGLGVLETANSRFPRDGAEILETFSLPSFYENFVPNDNLKDTEKHTELMEKVRSVLSQI